VKVNKTTMKNRHLTQLILLFLTLTNSSHLIAQFNAPRFQRITTAEGLPDGEVRQIREDKDGYIWFATAQGICRYDGYRTQLLRGGKEISTMSLATDRPLAFCWDNQYRWWIGSDWAGVAVYDAPKQIVFRIRDAHWSKEYPSEGNTDTLNNSAISILFNDKKSKIWIGTFSDGLALYDLEKQRLDKSEIYGTQLFKGCAIKKIDKDVNGNIWVAATKKGLWRFDNTQKQWLEVSNNKNIRHFSLDTEGGAWFVSDKQIFYYNPKTQTVSTHFESDLKKIAPISETYKILFDQKKRLWIAASHGLILFKGGGIPAQLFRHDPKNPYSLLSNFVEELFEDSKGNIWLACGNDGVCMLPNNYDKIQVFDNNTTTHRIEDLAIAPDSTLYAITQTHLIISHFPYYSTDFIPIKSFLTCENIMVSKIQIGQNGHVYFGTNCGIWQYLPKEKRGVFICPSNINPSFKQQYGFTSLNILGDSLLTFSSYEVRELTLFDLKKKKMQVFKDAKLGYNTVFMGNIIQDSKDAFWSNSENGLKRFNGFKMPLDTCQTVSHFLKGTYVDNNNAGAPIFRIGDVIWWGRINGGGLNIISTKDSTYRHFLKENGLFDNSITTLDYDKTGKIWAGTSFGISRIQIPTDVWTTNKLDVQNYSFQDGLPHNTVLCSALSRDKSQVFVGTVGGLAMLNTEGVDTAAPKLVFTALNVYNKVVNPNDSFNILTTDINKTKLLTLHHYQAFFTLEVSGLHYANPKQTRYEYRLSGLGDDWIDNGFNNILSFNNMASGEYLLEVKAMSNNGVWSAIKTLKIKVLPAFWARWWFILGLVLLFLSGVYGLYQFRINQMKRVQDLQNSLAADLHDDIGSALSNIEILGFLTQNQDQLPEKAQKLILKMANEAKKTNESLHQLVWTMNTENEGLEATLAKLNRMAVDSLEPQGITLSVDAPEKINGDIKLGREKQRDLILVFKEILTNIGKHAKATRVSISISSKQGILLIDIEDNGNGFNPQPQKEFGGNGLNNMTKRMTKYGGSTTVKNREDAQGTMVQIRLPM
jgi:ligand-binding sensor domain-containing protein/two-component sensor histidine kinase